MVMQEEPLAKSASYTSCLGVAVPEPLFQSLDSGMRKCNHAKYGSSMPY